ncbi:MAG: DUF971 domain-containing protein [Ignavibacteria bacterium]|nr:DUF971 domain-containing protein [Ignavibacteria bacterium]
MKIKKLTQISEQQFDVIWDDGHRGPVDLRVLRDFCPCAGCKGETVLLKTYVPPPADKQTPGRYKLLSVEKVGGYAMKFEWGDGHSLGLYTWEHLRSLCGCGCQSSEKGV